jgi:hypothetical protein
MSAAAKSCTSVVIFSEPARALQNVPSSLRPASPGLIIITVPRYVQYCYI